MPEKSAFSRLKLVRTDDMPPPPIAPSPFVELGVASPFSFLRGASDAIELVGIALRMGYDAIGITDRNTLAGVVRAYAALKEYYEEHPTREIAVLQLSRGTPNDYSRGFRFGNFVQTMLAQRSEVEAVFTGQKQPQQAMDDAVKRGNEILRQFEKLNAGKGTEWAPEAK